MKLNKKNKLLNIGRFVDVGDGEVVYVDNKEKVWTQQNISDLVKGYRNYLNFVETADYYSKSLK